MAGTGRARTILVAGTASHVGKSTVVAGLCRHLADCGVDVTPFKAQNMSNNARAVPGGEIGVSQYVQARAAGVSPTTDHNPVLLKPRGEGESQLVIDGQPVGHFAAGTYFDEHWHEAREAARAGHDRLAAEHDVVVAEGAGAIAEPNLLHRDLANLETARFADAAILLVADIERGGAFASIAGSMELLPEDVRERVCGVLINKFRGDRSILDAAITDLESRYDLPVLGVLPHDDPGLPAEDSVSLPPAGKRETVGGDDGVPEEQRVTLGVLRLPRISNFTDLEPLAREPGVRVCYLPLAASLADASGRPVDAVVIPGTKNTVDDLQALRASGMDERLHAFEGPIIGLCGGYQLLGERLRGADLEGTGDATVVEGLGLLPVETSFSTEKRVERVERELTGVGPLEGASGPVTGYEIHMGETEPTGSVRRPFPQEGAARGDVLGTYLHDIFENEHVREAFLSNVYAATGREQPDVATTLSSPFEDAADLIATNAALDPLFPAEKLAE